MASTASSTKEQWLTNLSRMWDVHLNDLTILEKLAKFNDVELFEIIRTKTQFIILCLRYYKENKKDSSENISLNLFGNTEKTNIMDADVVIHKLYDYVPVISSNSIRGTLRDIIMYDLCKRVGIDENHQLTNTFYARLFSGGALTAKGDGDSDLKENISYKEELFKHCPPAQLLGLSLEGGILHSQLIVGIPKLVCKENGNGKHTFWNYIDTEFGTRMDDLKKEDNFVKIDKASSPAIQMKYEYEVITQGSEWEHYFILKQDRNDVLNGVFYHLLDLFCKHPYVGGLSSNGYGYVDLSALRNQINYESVQLYLDYIDNNKNEIREFLVLQK